MKRTVSFLLQFVFSCACTLAVLTLLYLLVCGITDNGNGKAPVYFSDDGKVLSFFGETVCVDRDSLEEIADYPSRTADFCKGFLPNTVQSVTEHLASELSQSAKSFLTLALRAVRAFFSVGATSFEGHST